jgi:hypothetical protein
MGMAHVQRYASSGASYQNRWRSMLGATVAVVLLGTQFMAALHLLVVPHRLAASMGQVVVCAEAHEQRVPPGPASGPYDETPRRDEQPAKECRVYALFQQAQILESPAPILPPSRVVRAIVAPRQDAVFHRWSRVYLFSPAQSPPLSALI